MKNTTKIQTLSLSMLILMAAMTINSMQTSSIIFADDDNDEDKIKGEVGEPGEIIAKLVANGDDNNNVLTPVEQKEQTILPVAEAQQQVPPPAKQSQQQPVQQEEEDKGMKIVLGDIVLPINQKSDFTLELPFSKIVVEPITK